MKKVMSYIIAILISLSFLACAEKVQADVPLEPSDPTIPVDPVPSVAYEIGSVVEGGILYKVEGITGFVLYPYAMEPSVWTTQRSGAYIAEGYRISSSDSDGQANVAQMKEKSSDLSTWLKETPVSYSTSFSLRGIKPGTYVVSVALVDVTKGNVPAIQMAVDSELLDKDGWARIDSIDIK